MARWWYCDIDANAAMADYNYERRNKKNILIMWMNMLATVIQLLKMCNPFKLFPLNRCSIHIFFCLYIYNIAGERESEKKIRHEPVSFSAICNIVLFKGEPNIKSKPFWTQLLCEWLTRRIYLDICVLLLISTHFFSSVCFTVSIHVSFDSRRFFFLFRLLGRQQQIFG